MDNMTMISVKGIFALLFTVFTFLTGGFDTPLTILCVMIILDYITGISVAFKNHNLSSSIGAKGILKKSAIFIVIIVALMADRLTGDQFIFRTAVCYFYTANEGISILENVAALGVAVPNKLLRFLQKIKSEEEEPKVEQEEQQSDTESSNQ